jgi:glycine/D-amino acid oxidase-like deaminating enzyme
VQRDKDGRPRCVLVIGAGVVGLSVALQLQRRQFDVVVVDELPPGDGSSYGNSGFLVADTAMPTSLPGTLKKVPGWLMDPAGPVSISLSYLPTAVPWLFRYLAAGKLDRVHQSSDALRELHRRTFSLWEAMVGTATMQELVRQDGQVYVWDQSQSAVPTVNIEDSLRARLGIKSQVLGREQLQSLFPGIAPSVDRGLLIPGNGHTINPGRLVKVLADRLCEAGGTIVQERVQRIWPKGDGGWSLMTNLSNRFARHVVVAAGAWSARLLAPLGIRIPLETERGYHAVLPNPSVKLQLPILHKSGYFGVNSMEMGLRLAGTVEFAGLDAPPNMARAEMLVGQAKQLFPSLQHDEPVFWMGHRPSTPDSVPVIGQFSRHAGLYACFGHGHAGLTGAPASGLLTAQLIAGETPAFPTTPYSPARFYV